MKLRRILFLALLLVLSGSYATSGQKLAIVTPDRTPRDVAYAALLSQSLHRKINILDESLVDAAFRSARPADPFNMSVGESRLAAAVMGCEFFVLVRAAGSRRTSFSQPEYYESFAFIYLVDGRTGMLVSWKRHSFESDSQLRADEMLTESVGEAVTELMSTLSAYRLSQVKKPYAGAAIEEVPADGTPASTGLKPPIPYKRIKPEYTTTAFLYDVRATIDIEADIAEDGRVLATRVVRWAGFGLEESVEKTVRTMNWRPAMRNGKALPMRILLRYNFTKVDDDR